MSKRNPKDTRRRDSEYPTGQRPDDAEQDMGFDGRLDRMMRTGTGRKPPGRRDETKKRE